MPSPRRILLIALPVVALVVAACTTAASPSSGGNGGGGTSVTVTLQEWAVVLDKTSAPAGDVTFEVTNAGPEDIHEFVIIKTDLAPGDLPTDDTGAVLEEGEGMVVVDEIEDIAVDGSGELTVNLEAGNYVLICNIYSQDEQEAHYQEGMRSAFTVE